VKTLDQLDRAMLDDVKSLLEAHASQLPVRRVTVIGNAPLEPDDKRVEIIETSDLVFRCNSFVLDEPGEQPRLGRKTDVVVAARRTRVTPWFFRDYSSRAYLVNDSENVRKPDPPLTPRSWPEDLAAWPISNRVFGWPLKRLIRPETDGVGAVPTTGTASAYVARRLFPDAELYLTGYSFLDDREQTSWKHQWGDECIVHPTHKIDREGALLQSWVDEGSAVLLP
jgi:hypothetical protein